MNFVIAGIRKNARETPAKAAIRWRCNDFPYAALEKMVDARSRALQLKGIRHGDTVAIEALRGLDAVIDVAALWTLGATALPYPSGSQAQLVQSIVSRSNAKIIMRPGGDLRLTGSGSSANVVVNGTILVLPTSGSTGEPKLVPLAEKPVAAFTEWAQQEFGLSQRTVLSFAPINFDLSLLEVWAVLVNGGTVDLLSDREALNPHSLREYLKESTADLFQAVPYVFQTLRADATEDSPLSLPHVRDVIVTGSKANRDTRCLIADVFPAAKFHNVYGSTETNNSFMATIPRTALINAESLPIGRPLPGVEAHVVDHDGNVLAGQATGELHVRTPFMMTGYLGSGELVPDLFHTGDVVFRDSEGTFHIESRSSRIVKVRGNRISLDQVEAVLEMHPGVEEAVVIARPDPDQALRIEAMVKLHAGQQLSTLALRAHCSKHLPAFAMPGFLHKVAEPFPRTSTHKIDRNASELIHYEGKTNA